MCGIAGIASATEINGSDLSAMHDALVHRGPDGSGFLEWENGGALQLRSRPSNGRGMMVGFAHNRLAIIDQSDAAAQPMIDATKTVALTYNGELYNYVELRDELIEQGHSFKGSGDTEVVLAAWLEWGRDCVLKFVGMWALAVLDTREHSLFLSRDRFGIKPLYWANTADGFLFASEIKSLLAAGVRSEPNEGAVRRYLMTGRVDESEDTFFADIQQLRPAHDARLDLREIACGLKFRCYWSPPEPGSWRGSAEDAQEQFAQLFRDSVRLHIRSDVSVGSCLSGGLDSSAVVCVADALRRSGELAHYAHHALGYIPADSVLSERRFMQAIVRQTGIQMSYVEPSATQVVGRVHEIIRQQDEPFGSASVLAQWFVFRSAQAKGLKVMLDGQGADEYLAGYSGYLRVRAEELLRRRRLFSAAGLMLGSRSRNGALPLGPRAALDLFLVGARGSMHVGEPPAAVELLANKLQKQIEPSDWVVEPPGSLEETLRRHLTKIGLPALLRFEDRNSMAHSIEARVPFLDHRLVEYALALPTRHKLRGAETKAILRRSLVGVLPDVVRERRDKIGFRAEPAVTRLLAERERSALVAAQTSWEEEWFAPAAVRRLLDRRNDPEAEFSLWRLINLKLWLRTVVSGVPEVPSERF